jgi:ribosomal protein L37AE/L43A
MDTTTTMCNQYISIKCDGAKPLDSMIQGVWVCEDCYNYFAATGQATPAPSSRTPLQEFVESSYRTCRECDRKFDVYNEDDMAEWHYGHDCES